MRYCFSRSLAARQSIRRRLVLALLVALFVFGLSWGSEAFAGYPPATYLGDGGVYTGSSASGVCSTWVSATGGGSASLGTGNNGTQTTCLRNGSLIGTILGQCADGSVVNFVPSNVNNVCSTAPPVTCTAGAGTYLGASAQGTATSIPTTVCIQGCAYATGSVAVQVGTSYSTDLGKATGATCSGANYDVIDTTTKPTDPPSLVSCQKRGMVYGTVNGVGICAASGTVPNSTVQQNGGTTTQNTDASGVQAAPQTELEQVTCSNVGGVAQCTKTVTSPDGSKQAITQDQKTFCEQNPSAQVCKDSEGTASGGSDCTAPPSCSGDAIQCMMVNQQWRTRCDSNQPSSLSDLGTKLVNGQDPVLAAGAGNPFNRQATAVGGSIDQTAFLAGGGLSDKVVTVSGQAITLPFSRLNQYLVWIGHLFVVLSLIGAIRIVLGGFK